jgi:predicted unusual protein kinase regulating ubiquinone biosynthesis (AarF/ABC1/UbiB family)
MQPAQITFQSYVMCNALDKKNAKQQISDIFRILRENHMTHGDFHLGNLMFLPDMKTLKLIDSGYATDLVLDHYYDLIQFTVASSYLFDTLSKSSNSMRQKNSERIKEIRDEIYAEVRKFLIEFDNTKEYKMIETIPERQKYFKIFETNRSKAQLFEDGKKWLTDVRLKLSDEALNRSIDLLYKNGNLGFFKDFQNAVLTSALDRIKKT